MKYFFDTEFIENGSDSPIYLLSIGIVSEDGREYYAQKDYEKFPQGSDWVARNVFPSLLHFDMGLQERSCVRARPSNHPNYASCSQVGCPWKLHYDLRDEIRDFCNPEQYGKPEFWAYYADYDWVALCQLFGSMLDLPKGWPMYCQDIKQFCLSVGDPPLPSQEGEHHALTDAKWNKVAYDFLYNHRQIGAINFQEA